MVQSGSVDTDDLHKSAGSTPQPDPESPGLEMGGRGVKPVRGKELRWQQTGISPDMPDMRY